MTNTQRRECSALPSTRQQNCESKQLPATLGKMFFQDSQDGRTQGATITPAQALCPLTDVRSCKHKHSARRGGGERLRNCAAVPRRRGVTGKKGQDFARPLGRLTQAARTFAVRRELRRYDRGPAKAPPRVWSRRVLDDSCTR